MIVEVPSTTKLKIGDGFVIVPEFVFTDEHNQHACKAFETTNPVHLQRGVVPGNLVTGWITERLRDWALQQPDLSGDGHVVLNRMKSALFVEPVRVGCPMKLTISISDLNEDHVEFYAFLSRLGVKRTAFEGIFSGGRIRGR